MCPWNNWFYLLAPPFTCCVLNSLISKLETIKIFIIGFCDHFPCSVSRPARAPATWTLQTILGHCAISVPSVCSSHILFLCHKTHPQLPTEVVPNTTHQICLVALDTMWDGTSWPPWDWVGVTWQDLVSELWVQITHVFSRLEHLTAGSRLSRAVFPLPLLLDPGVGTVVWAELPQAYHFLDVLSKKIRLVV